MIWSVVSLLLQHWQRRMLALLFPGSGSELAVVLRFGVDVLQYFTPEMMPVYVKSTLTLRAV